MEDDIAIPTPIHQSWEFKFETRDGRTGYCYRPISGFEHLFKTPDVSQETSDSGGASRASHTASQPHVAQAAGTTTCLCIFDSVLKHDSNITGNRVHRERYGPPALTARRLFHSQAIQTWSSRFRSLSIVKGTQEDTRESRGSLANARPTRKKGLPWRK